jgi:lysophospholipase
METTDRKTWFENTPDGTALRLGRWKPATRAKGTVVLLQGRTEFLEKYAETIDDLTTRGFDVWSMDWRGQGLSDRALANRHKGHIDSFDTYIADLEWFTRRIAEPATGPTFVLAHSMGGHIAVRALLEGRLAADGIVLSAPMIDLPLAGTKRLMATSLSRLASRTALGGRYAPGMGDYEAGRVEFSGNELTSDRQRFDAIYTALAANPDLALGGVTFGWLNAALRSIRALDRLKTRSRPELPALFLTAGADTVVSVEAQTEMAAAGSEWEHIVIEGARHEILHESDPLRDRFWDAFDRFTAQA